MNNDTSRCNRQAQTNDYLPLSNDTDTVWNSPLRLYNLK